MKKIFFLILIIFCVLRVHVLAQQSLQPNANRFSMYLKPDSKKGWIDFRKENPYHGNDVFLMASDLWNIRAEDELRIVKMNMDVAGNAHYKYVQYYKGIRLEGVEQIAHERNGVLHLVNGDFVENLELNTTPVISAEFALQKALEKFPAKRYLWEDATAEQDFKQKKNNPNATLYPTPELLIVKKDTKREALADNFVLAYRMFIFAEDPYIAEYVYVDAHSGEYLRSRSLEIQCNATTISTTYNGDQTIYTKYTTDECGYLHDLSTGYFSWDDCNPDTEIKSYTSGTYGG